MALITCALEEILNPPGCIGRAGISELYWYDVGTVDWAAMAADPLKFDATNQLVLGYEMIGDAIMNKITFEPKSAYYEFVYTQDTGVYTLFITLSFRGKDAARRNKLAAAIACCNIGLHIIGNSGEQRIVGQDWNGESFSNILIQLAIARHLDGGGQLGTSVARDELDFGGESFYPPLFGNVPKSSLPLT